MHASLEMQTDATAEKGRSWIRGPLKHHADPPSQVQMHTLLATSKILSNTPSCLLIKALELEAMLVPVQYSSREVCSKMEEDAG